MSFIDLTVKHEEEKKEDVSMSLNTFSFNNFDTRIKAQWWFDLKKTISGNVRNIYESKTAYKNDKHSQHMVA